MPEKSTALIGKGLPPHGAYRAGVDAEMFLKLSGGVMYADFGIFDVYDPLLDNEISGLQINIFMTPRRKRICVRIHDADIATEDLNLVWLLTELRVISIMMND